MRIFDLRTMAATRSRFALLYFRFFALARSGLAFCHANTRALLQLRQTSFLPLCSLIEPQMPQFGIADLANVPSFVS